MQADENQIQYLYQQINAFCNRRHELSNIMRKSGTTLLIFFTINIALISVLALYFPLKIKENTNTAAISASNQIFLPLVSTRSVEYYVSPQGSDSNPGTSLKPWKTISYAALKMLPGDTVYIREGVYNEAPRFTISGTQANPIKILAYPGETAVVDGNNRLPVSYRGLISVFGEWVLVSGLEIRNSKYTGLGLYGKHDTASNIYAHHSETEGIYLGGDYGIVENSRAWRNSLQNEFGMNSSWAAGLVAGNDSADGITEHTILRNNVVWENWGEGISTYKANGTLLEDNISHDNYSTNIYISDSINILCQQNFVYMNPDSYLYGYGSNAGIMMGDEVYDPPSANITVINNISQGNHGNFWWWQGSQGGGMDNVLIANNTFVNGIGDQNKGRGGVIISRGDHWNVRFENNLVQQDGDLPVIATITQSGVTYSHNLWSKPSLPAASGPGDVIGDPHLAKTGDLYSADWFRLTDASPAIGKALTIPGIINDYFGALRDSTPDLGAAEYMP